MKPGSQRSFLLQTGFTLVEIMVGLAIGMLATIVIMQVFSVFENQKRVTTGTADAQTNGGIALYNIGRELQLAGYPLMPTTNSPLECTTLTVNGVANTINLLSPVTITEGTSDTITIHYGNSQMGGIPEQITAVGAPTANDVTVNNNLGCQVEDIALITNGASCGISSASAVTGATTVTLTNAAAATVGANLACLGSWNEVVYAVNNGELTRNGDPVVAGIINLQAQYGISATANSNQITQWVNAVNGQASGDWGTNLTVANRNRIKAVRLAVVARNPKMESSNIAAGCSSTTAAAPTGLCAWAGNASSPAPTVNLSADANWQRYRYRVFETIIPLRNVIWSKDTL